MASSKEMYGKIFIGYKYTVKHPNKKIYLASGKLVLSTNQPDFKSLCNSIPEFLKIQVNTYMLCIPSEIECQRVIMMIAFG